MANFTVSYKYLAINKWSPQVRRMIKDTMKFRRKVKKSSMQLKKMSIELNRTSRRMTNFRTVIGAIGATGAMKNLISVTADFETAMNRVNAVTYDATKTNAQMASEMDIVRKKAMRWGAETQFSAVEIGNAMAELGMKGLKTQGIISLMPGVMNLAAAGQLELADAAAISQDILGQFGMNIGKSKYLVDLLSQAASNSSQSVTEIAAAMRNTGVQAKLSGQSVKQTTIYLMALAQKGERGARAGTYLMNMFSDLSKAPKKVMVGFRKLGIDINKFRDSATGQITDFMGLLDVMRKKGAGGKTISEMFNKRSAKAMNLLLSTSNEQLMKFAATQDKATGSGKRMAGILMKGLPGDLKRAESAFEGMKLVMLTSVLPALTKVIKGVTSFMSDLQKNNPTLLKFATYGLMGAVALSAIIIPLGVLIATIAASGTVFAAAGTFLTMLSGKFILLIAKTILWNAALLANPMFLIVAGIMAAVTAIILLIKHWEKAKKAVKEFFGIRARGVNETASSFFGFERPSAIGRRAAVEKTKIASTNNLNLSGKIGVQAEKGTKVTGASIKLNTGDQGMEMVGA